jgi:hypothetical protein
MLNKEMFMGIMRTLTVQELDQVSGGFNLNDTFVVDDWDSVGGFGSGGSFWLDGAGKEVPAPSVPPSPRAPSQDDIKKAVEDWMQKNDRKVNWSASVKATQKKDASGATTQEFSVEFKIEGSF